MTMPTPAQIDAIVQAVIAELHRRLPKNEPRVFAGRLFGLPQAEAVGIEEREIRVASGTVVTPLAIDHLKRRKISLRYVSVGEVRGKETGEWGFAIDGRSSGKGEALRRSLVDAWTELQPADAISWLIHAPGRGAILMTDEASVAAWRANRVDGIRAATAVDTDAVARAVKSLGVNLLVIEPAGLSIPFLKAMAAAFRRGGAPSEPEGLR
jgi:hypothetical protein